jgi:hypothetical protein
MLDSVSAFLQRFNLHAAKCVLPQKVNRARSNPHLRVLRFASVANFEKAPAEVQEILSKPIQQLGLKLEGSPLERFVHQLYKELDGKRLNRFRPRC